jgi:hypothetical protein
LLSGLGPTKIRHQASLLIGEIMAALLWHKSPDIEFVSPINVNGRSISASISEGDPRGGTTWIVYLDGQEFSSGREPGPASARARAETFMERARAGLK